MGLTKKRKVNPSIQSDNKKTNAAKVRRSIVNELNESALTDLDDEIDENEKENKVSGRKKPSEAHAKSNREMFEKQISKKKTEVKPFQTNIKNVSKAAKTHDSKTAKATKTDNTKTT